MLQVGRMRPEICEARSTPGLQKQPKNCFLSPEASWVKEEKLLMLVLSYLQQSDACILVFNWIERQVIQLLDTSVMIIMP